MAEVPPWFYRQSGVISVRREDGRTEVLLVTSRKGKRWVIPKGVVEPGLTPAASAAKEAWEEAGVRGTLRPEPLGTYRYWKWGGRCTVEVFLLEVESVAESWPEEHRTRRWSSPAEAAEAVREPALQALIRGVPLALGPGAPANDRSHGPRYP
ncbi:MAG: NUDIX hydrolase [Proteobacteria bacterium]|nr:NUDIX hydrolase [Pseudomonadota bacterium]